MSTAPASPKHTNHLVGETSPYLLQHAHNPVDWYPWGPEALERARREDKPIFLSIGYAACHWCHVMERESFESEEVAAILNRDFISIKVDREERPDLDDIYMTAVQVTTGSGGWPMSVFLTPDLKPFFAGTYFPPENRYGRVGFKTVLTQLIEVYRSQRDRVTLAADEITEQIQRITGGGEGGAPITRDTITKAVRSLLSQFDPQHGGFGSAPKFPPSMRLDLFLREYGRQPDTQLLRAVTVTLDQMARGGMYDQIGGGFARYSTDERWLVPHFEKRLYDNALLAPVYVDAFAVTEDPYYERIVTQTLDWVLREMTSPEGGFYSTLDADSEGEEGRFYVWSPEQVIEVLGPEDGAKFNRIFDITPEGNFEGHSIPNLLQATLEERAAELGMGNDALEEQVDAWRGRLLEARSQRVWPGLDDKILTSWNGLMIHAFAHASRVLGEERYRQAAERATEFVLRELRQDGRLLRTHRNGQSKLNGYLDDYSFLAVALVELHEATDEARWLEEARQIVATMNDLFWDEYEGGYFYTSRDHEELIARMKSVQDNAIPSGSSMAALALVRLAALTDDTDLRQRADRTLGSVAGSVQQFPAAFPQMLIAADLYLKTAAGAAEDVLTLRAFVSQDVVRPGDVFRVAVRAEIRPGWHVNSNGPLEAYLIPTALEIKAAGFEQVREFYPEGEQIALAFSEQPLSVYQGTVVVGVELQAPADLRPGRRNLTLRLKYQPCDEQHCLTPAEQVLRVSLPIGRVDDEPHPRDEALFAALVS